MKKSFELNSYEIIERMKKICNITQDKELAEIVDIAASSVAAWRKRNLVPLENLIKISINYNVSVDFLLFGKEVNPLTSNEKLFLMAFNSLDDQRKMELMGSMMGLNSSAAPVVNQSNQGGTNNYINGNNNNVSA